jgi:hypothetical protein
MFNLEPRLSITESALSSSVTTTSTAVVARQVRSGVSQKARGKQPVRDSVGHKGKDGSNGDENDGGKGGNGGNGGDGGNGGNGAERLIVYESYARKRSMHNAATDNNEAGLKV